MDRQKININGRKCNKNNSCNVNNYNNISINNHNNNINYGQRNNGLEWTNERHSKFLSSMEASFVQNMLVGSSNSISNNSNITKLDRFIPDISESTLDVRSSVHLSNRVNRSTYNKQKRTPTRPRKMGHDQVVPQLEEKTSDKGVKFDLNK